MSLSLMGSEICNPGPLKTETSGQVGWSRLKEVTIAYGHEK